MKAIFGRMIACTFVVLLAGASGFTAYTAAQFIYSVTSNHFVVREARIVAIRKVNDDPHVHHTFAVSLMFDDSSAITVANISEGTSKALQGAGLWRVNGLLECARTRKGWALSYDFNAGQILLPYVILSAIAVTNVLIYLVLGALGYKPVRFGRQPLTNMQLGSGTAFSPNWGPLNASWRGYVCFVNGAVALSGLCIVLGVFERELLHVTWVTAVMTLIATLCQVAGGIVTAISIFSQKP